MTTFDKITDIIFIVLTIIYILILVIMFIINYKNDLFKPTKYYKIKYIFDGKDESETVIEAKTPQQAIKKLIHKYQYGLPLNELTDIISCTEINYYKCLKEESKDE